MDIKNLFNVITVHVHAPQGRNYTVGLDKGDKVISGRSTQSLMSSGVLPKFSRGTSEEEI